MALTQSARLPGPSWDEEVVPALRKRLETESKTLARRMSAISIRSNTEDPSSNFSLPAVASALDSHQGQQGDYDNISDPRLRASYQQSQTSTPSMPPRANGVQSARKPVTTPFHRSRTYSQPGPPVITQPSNAIRPRAITGKSGSGFRSPHPADPRPTRIPKASRAPNSHGTASPYLNGSSPGSAAIPIQFPKPNHPPDFRPYHSNSSNPSQLNPGISQSLTRIINEPPPFNTNGSNTSIPDVLDTPRASIDSEERPFEHWYRGEISRNGGVGEIKVGRRLEMLEIANYGHTISNRSKALATRRAALLALEDNNNNAKRHRKRADSIAGIGTKDRERGSLYLDEDERADQVDRVMDEDPLTDLDGENSDIASISHYYRYSNHNSDYEYNLGSVVNGDEVAPASPQDVSPPGSTYARSATPTQSIIGRPSSRQTSSTATRIPPSSERKSSESRASTRTQRFSATVQQSRPETPSVSHASPPPISTPLTKRTATTPPSTLPESSSTPTRRQPQRQLSSPAPQSTPAKRGVSPNPTNLSSAKKPKTKVAKATRAKTPIKKVENDEAQRRSVAEYPNPGDSENMADAIPVWTQPKPRQGNWDDVVLPVVARKKGLNDYYETANGSSQPKKKEEDGSIAPAPGTFGYDGSKYRRPFTDAEDIPMDEFGQSHPKSNIQAEKIPEVPEDQEDKPPEKPPPEPEPELERPRTQTSIAHDHIHVPIKPPPSPAPFSHYATMLANTSQIQQSPPSQATAAQEEEDRGGGCCKCVVM